MDEKERNKSGLLGLIVGFIFGSGFSYQFLLFQNWLSQYWNVVKPVEVTYQSVLPLGIIMGLSMGAAMRSGMFGD